MKSCHFLFAAALGACGGSSQAPSHSQPHGHHVHDHHHRFDNAEHWAKVFDDPARDEWQKPARVIELMAIAPGMSVADVGAGTGYFAVRLAGAVGPSGRVVAEDIEPQMVRWLGDRAKRENLTNVEPLLGTPDDPKLGPASLDRVLIVDTWHHVADRPAFAQKLAGALRPSGKVFIVDFKKDSPHGPPPEARLSPETVAKDLGSAALKTDILQDTGLPHQYVVVGSL